MVSPAKPRLYVSPVEYRLFSRPHSPRTSVAERGGQEAEGAADLRLYGLGEVDGQREGEEAHAHAGYTAADVQHPDVGS